MFRSKRSISLRMLKEVNDAGISLLWIAWSPVVPNAYGGPWCDPWTSVIAHQPGTTQISGFLKDEQIQGFKIIEKECKRHIHCVCLWNLVTLWHSKQFEHIHSAISWASWWHDLARWKYCTTYQGWKVVKWTSNQFSKFWTAPKGCFHGCPNSDEAVPGFELIVLQCSPLLALDHLASHPGCSKQQSQQPKPRYKLGAKQSNQTNP